MDERIRKGSSETRSRITQSYDLQFVAKNIATFLVNQQNIAAVYQGEEANEVMAYFYTIHDGKLVTLTDYGMRIFSKNIKNIQQNYIQTLRKKIPTKWNLIHGCLNRKAGN